MNIQTNYVSFGKVYMPKREVLLKNVGETSTKKLENLRGSLDAMSKKYDVWVDLVNFPSGNFFLVSAKKLNSNSPKLAVKATEENIYNKTRLMLNELEQFPG